MPRLPPRPSLSWTPEGAPHSDDVGDVYFSGDGLSEKRAVFLKGCGLPEAWENREAFTIAELGFGAGLNLLALWDLWRGFKPAEHARLHLVSTESALMSADDAARIHALWPELAALSAQLLARWPERAAGVQRIHLPDNLTLDLHIGDAAETLAKLDAGDRIDAWFLDGFAPSKNPDMWTGDIIAHVKRLSAPGARLATYTVAGDVRRALEAAGFSVAKVPGHGRKKERLEARLSGEAPTHKHPRTATIIGAGVAGAWVAHALMQRGLDVTVIDEHGPATGASGNPLALVMPRLDAGDTAQARALIAAFLHASRAWTQLPEDAACTLDVARLPGNERERTRFAKLLADPPLDVSLLEPRGDGLTHHRCIAVRPAVAIPALLDGARVVQKHTATSAEISADIVVICAGMGSTMFADAPLQGRLGQVESAPFPTASHAIAPHAIADGGYVVSAFDTLVTGATFEPAPDGPPPIKPEARAENLATLARLRPDIDATQLAFTSRASVRATTPDRFPLAGRLTDGGFILSGLGARGFLWAPLLAEHIASLALDEPSPLPTDIAATLDPARFNRR